MTSKELISISSAPYNRNTVLLDKRGYSLRPTRNISSDDTKTHVYARKEKKFRNLESAVNIKKLVTSVRSERKKLPTKDNVQESTDSYMDVSQFFEDVDFTSFSEMEDDAFQLAEYLESNDSPTIDSTSPTGFDPSVHDRIEEFLDMSIKGLQMATNFDAPNIVAMRNSTPKQMNKKSRSVTVDNCNSKRIQVHAADTSDRTNDRTNSLDVIDHLNRNCNSTGNSLKRRRSMLSRAPSNFDVSTEPIVASERNRSVSNNPFKKTIKKRIASTTSTVKEMPNSTPIEQEPPPVAKPSSKDVPCMMAYTTLTKTVALKWKMNNLFNRSCYNYLNGRSCQRNCKWNHSLPSAHEISEKLIRLSKDDLLFMYFNFVLKSNMSFVAYFPTICDVFGKRKMEWDLQSAISDCERRENIPFLKFIYNGLVMTGMSNLDALTTVIDKCCKNRECFDVFLEIICETDALLFIDLLEKYYLYGTISKQSAYKLLQQVVDAVAAADNSLLTVFIDILDSYSMYNGFDVETFQTIIPTVKNLVLGNLSLSQKLQHIASRMQ